MAPWLVLAPLFLSGCPIPIPPGYDVSSRQNIGPDISASLMPGVTTREEILLRLGEADGAAADGSWLAYGCIYSKGGVIFVLAAGGSAAGGGGEKTEYRRLVVTFDERGVLEKASFVSRDCWDSIFGFGSSGAASPPCMDIASPDAAVGDTRGDQQQRPTEPGR